MTNRSIFISSDQRILFLMVWQSFRCLLPNSQQAFMCLSLRNGFCLATLQRPDWWSITVMYWWLSFCIRFSHLHKGILDLGDHWAHDYLSDQGFSSPITQFKEQPKRVLVVQNFSEWWRTFSSAEICLYPFPDLCIDRILSYSSKDNSLELMANWHDRCVPFLIVSKQFN